MTTPPATPGYAADHEHAAPDPAHHADADAPGHDDHHDQGSLGPIDWRMWGVGVVGVIAALAVVACAVVATGFVFFDQLAPA